jgi:hypothetical protein
MVERGLVSLRIGVGCWWILLGSDKGKGWEIV